MRSTCGQHGACVLVVDDELDIRESLAEILRGEGYRVETASNGAEALAAIERASPCLMLLDLMMPVINGWQVMDRVSHEHANLRYCVMTASTEIPDMDCVLRKPLAVDELLRIVEAHCGAPKELGVRSSS